MTSNLKSEKNLFLSNESMFQGAALYVDGSSSLKSFYNRYLGNKSRSQASVIHLDNEEITKGYSAIESNRDTVSR